MFPTQRLRESRRLRLTIVAALWLIALASVLLMYWAWNTYSYTLRVVVGFAFFAEFSVIATCFAVLRRIGNDRPVTPLFVLSSLFLWEIVPGATLLLPFALFFPINTVPILLTVAFAIRARSLIGKGSELAGGLTLLLPVAFLVAVCFFRPWTVTSQIWPVVGTIHAVFLLIALSIIAAGVGRSRHHQLSHA